MKKISIMMTAVFLLGAAGNLRAQNVNGDSPRDPASAGSQGIVMPTENHEKKGSQLTSRDASQITGNLNGDGKAGGSSMKKHGVIVKGNALVKGQKGLIKNQNGLLKGEKGFIKSQNGLVKGQAGSNKGILIGLNKAGNLQKVDGMGKLAPPPPGSVGNSGLIKSGGFIKSGGSVPAIKK